MEELVTCEGTVHSIIFQNAENGYTVLRLLTEEGEVITVVGCIPCVAPGEHLAVSGVPETHPQHGEQLRAVELERSLPEDEEESLQLSLLRHLQGGGPRHRAADCGAVRRGDPGRSGAGAGAPDHAQRRHRPQGPGDRGELPPAHGPAAADGLSGPVPAASCPGYGAAAAVRRRARWRRCGRIPTSSPARRAAWSSPSPTGSRMGMGLAADSDQRLQAAVTFELSHNENNGHVFLPRNKLISATTQLLDSGGGAGGAGSGQPH